MSPDVCLVHLVWEPLGPEPLRRFLASYAAHSAGVEHRLLVCLNGFGRDQDMSPWARALESVEHEILRLERRALDLEAYRQALARTGAERFAFVNSHSVVIADRWLELLVRPLLDPATAIAGTGGSYESARSAAPLPLRPLRRGFAPFPNPHLRTNGFALTRVFARTLDWPLVRTKLDAWRLESGARSLTRQALERGRRVVVVGRDGIEYPPERWRQSATYRSGGQANLLLEDNRTRQWAQAASGRRRVLERLAWGP